MNLPKELVKAVAESPCRKYSGGLPCGTYLDDTDGAHPECAVAAVLRALPESEAVKAAGRRGIRWSADSYVECVLEGIARLADDQ